MTMVTSDCDIRHRSSTGPIAERMVSMHLAEARLIEEKIVQACPSYAEFPFYILPPCRYNVTQWNNDCTESFSQGHCNTQCVSPAYR